VLPIAARADQEFLGVGAEAAELLLYTLPGQNWIPWVGHQRLLFMATDTSDRRRHCRGHVVRRKM